MDFLLFEPQKIWQVIRSKDGTWGEPEVIIDAVEVPWDVKTRNGETYMTTYTGGHYGEGDLYVHFKTTTDGKTWEFYNGTEAVYTGGVSEVAFEFDMNGNMWAVTRNEDGTTLVWATMFALRQPIRLMSGNAPKCVIRSATILPRCFATVKRSTWWRVETLAGLTEMRVATWCLTQPGQSVPRSTGLIKPIEALCTCTISLVWGIPRSLRFAESTSTASSWPIIHRHSTSQT